MKRIGIIGGEQHIGEVTNLVGTHLDIVGSAVRDELVESAREQSGGPVFTDYRQMLDTCSPDIVAIANENDLKAEEIITCLKAGCDVICDKPLALTMDDQEHIEQVLRDNPVRRLLNLLTLRGHGIWNALRDVVSAGRIGTPAYTHVRMAVRLKRAQRPPWFLDSRRSGGLFLDLLIHGLDQVEWLTGRRIVAVTANTGNLGHPDEVHIRDHAAVYCELDDGSSAVVEGQRMLPDTKGSDYRVGIAGTNGYADMVFSPPSLVVTDLQSADDPVTELGETKSIVADWLTGGGMITQEASLRANRLAIQATQAAIEHKRVVV